MASKPVAIDRLAFWIGVLAVEQDDIVAVSSSGEQIGEIALCADGFGKDDCLSIAALLDDLFHGFRKGANQFSSFGVRANLEGQGAVALQLGNLRGQLRRVDWN